MFRSQVNTSLTLLQGLAPLERHHSSQEDQLHFWSSGVPVMFLSTKVVEHLFLRGPLGLRLIPFRQLSKVIFSIEMLLKAERAGELLVAHEANVSAPRA